jgi:hypothetical protein
VNFTVSNSALLNEKEFFFISVIKIEKKNYVIDQLQMLRCNISKYTRRDSVAGVDRKIGGL